MAGRSANFNWLSGPVQVSLAWTGTAASTTSFITLHTFVRSGTLRRMIIDFFMMIRLNDNDINAVGRAGIIVVAPQVAAVGATAVPRPNTDSERPWMWNRAYAANQLENNTGASGVDKYIALHLHDDVRGMRKFKEGDVLIFVLENAAGATIDTVCSARFLAST